MYILCIHVKKKPSCKKNVVALKSLGEIRKCEIEGGHKDVKVCFYS